MIAHSQVPLLGSGPSQEDLAQAHIERVFFSLFLPLHPQLVLFRVANGYPVEGGLSEGATPERVAEEAEEYALAGLRKLGFERRRIGL